MVETACDPELQLSLGTGDSRPSHRSSSATFTRVESLLRNSTQYQKQQQKQQQMTIFYQGRVFVCDATENQARAIISMAKREIEDMIKTKENLQQQASIESSSSTLPQPQPSSPQAALPQILNPAGLSMKRSLQRFLQKRKARISEVSPYSQKQKLLSFPVSCSRHKQ